MDKFAQALAPEELGEFVQAVLAVAALRMHRGIIEEYAIAARLQLLANHESFISSPVRIVHARRLVIAAIPRGQGIAFAVLLPPRGGRQVKPRPEFRRPVLVKGIQLNDGRGADVANRQADAQALRIAQVSDAGLPLLGNHFWR